VDETKLVVAGLFQFCALLTGIKDWGNYSLASGKYNRRMPADIVQLKIEWAEKHIDELERCLAVCFHDVKPFQLAIKDDADKGESVLYVKRAQELPPTLPLIIGDAISNLYSSLDYLACELCGSDRAAFPISELVPTTKDQKERYEKQVCGMSEDVRKIIKDMEPYRGSDNSLWTLHKLNNINKHRALLTVAYGAIIVPPSGKWEPHVALKEGVELSRVPLDLPGKDKIKVLPVIAFNEPEADLVGSGVSPVIKGCLRDVKKAAEVLRPHRRAHFHLSGGG
jgi:hypothetical protein